ncbi:hypothetical protein SOVF_173510 [Spinacia oleracea]|nr:hypothetical protein SOVF_173510 [Spinacia oleracea]
MDAKRLNVASFSQSFVITLCCSLKEVLLSVKELI